MFVVTVTYPGGRTATSNARRACCRGAPWLSNQKLNQALEALAHSIITRCGRSRGVQA